MLCFVVSRPYDLLCCFNLCFHVCFLYAAGKYWHECMACHWLSYLHAYSWSTGFLGKTFLKHGVSRNLCKSYVINFSSAIHVKVILLVNSSGFFSLFSCLEMLRF